MPPYSIIIMFIAIAMTTNISIWAQPANQNRPTLRGLTSLRPPFVEKDLNGKLIGFFVDLLDEMALIGNFNYSLRDPGNQHTSNDPFQNRPPGLITDIHQNRADFAIADYLYRTASAQRYVEFTDSYMESNLSALIHKDRIIQNNIKTIDDLLDQRTKPPAVIPINYQQQQQQQQQQSNQQQQQQPEIIQLGTVRPIYRDLSVGTDPLSRRIYEQLHNNPSNMAENRQIGIERALKTPYAFIQESINNELAMDEYCELTQIKLESQNLPKADTHYEFGIIGQKFSTHLETMNRAIRQLKANGRLDELKRRYWNRKCNGGTNNFEQYRYLMTVVTTLFSLFMSIFILS
ncbi:putative glutamate receptor [Dermatophagoides pteronyssinus]|uniref:Uncharacterized protein LOC113798209 n=1 Tax=Dermatophagoides pteronyssinus TaxID=6956 RepID=A0A6P6YIC8_DERPT|nr:uncharacterized protein LOC113798209 [Dermatophagoides pteronyssinus]